MGVFVDNNIFSGGGEMRSDLTGSLSANQLRVGSWVSSGISRAATWKKYLTLGELRVGCD